MNVVARCRSATTRYRSNLCIQLAYEIGDVGGVLSRERSEVVEVERRRRKDVGRWRENELNMEVL